MSKNLIVVVLVSIVLAALLSACSSTPSAVCPTDGNDKVGYWVALEGSVTANNPTGVCKNTVSGSLMAGLRSFASYFAEVNSKVEGVKTCYDKTGMGTSCVATAVK